MSDMIPYWDYLREYSSHEPEIMETVSRVMRSGKLVLGPEVDAFEREFASYIGVRYAVGVNSGTDALFLALKALGIGTGHEVITVSNTAVPTVAAIRATGATPVFVDIEEDTLLMDAELIEGAVSPSTRAIVPVHLYGLPARMDKIMETAHRYGLRVVEDCAQSAGAEFDGEMAGAIGHIGAFSFYPTKVLGAFGDAGAVLTNDEDLALKLRRLRFYGMERDYYSIEEGYNSRLDELHAAMLRVKLLKLDSEIARRNEIAKIYFEILNGVGDIRLPAMPKGRTHCFYSFTVRTNMRNALLEHLTAHGIGTKINYPVPVHLMSGYGFLGVGKGSLPMTEMAATEILSLPVWPGLREAEAVRVADAVKEFYA